MYRGVGGDTEARSYIVALEVTAKLAHELCASDEHLQLRTYPEVGHVDAGSTPPRHRRLDRRPLRRQTSGHHLLLPAVDHGSSPRAR
jgi:hypothetical protein